MLNNIILIGGTENNIELFSKVSKQLKNSLSSVYTSQKGKQSVSNTKCNTYVKGPLGLKDIGLIIKDSLKAEAIIICSDIGEDPDSITAVKILKQECNVKIFEISSLNDLNNLTT